MTGFGSKFGSNGFAYDQNPTGRFPDGIVLSNNYEIAETGLVAIFITKCSFEDLNETNPDIADRAKLVSLILADRTYLDSIWGERWSDTAYHPIFWK